MEGSDQVFAARMVHPGFAADGGINHGQKRCRHLHDTNPTQPGGCGETGHVADDPPAQGQHQGPPFELAAEGGIVDAGNGGWCFLVFTGFDHQQLGAEALVPQAC